MTTEILNQMKLWMNAPLTPYEEAYLKPFTELLSNSLKDKVVAREYIRNRIDGDFAELMDALLDVLYAHDTVRLGVEQEEEKWFRDHEWLRG